MPGSSNGNLSPPHLSLDVIAFFKETIQMSPGTSIPVAAIQALSDCMQNSQAKTMVEFIKELNDACGQLREITSDCIAVAAGCELFTRVVTRAAHDTIEVLFINLICRISHPLRTS